MESRITKLRDLTECIACFIVSHFLYKSTSIDHNTSRSYGRMAYTWTTINFLFNFLFKSVLITTLVGHTVVWPILGPQ